MLASNVVRVAQFALLALVAACGPGAASEGSASGESEETASESGESGDEGFDPRVCGSWDDEEDPPPGPDPASLPPEVQCESAEACPQFVDVSAAAGLNYAQYRPVVAARAECLFDLKSGDGVAPDADCEPQWFTGGAAVADVNADSWPDLFVSRLGAANRLFINQGDGTFVDEAADRGLGDCDFANGAVFGDIDNDGDADLLLTSLGARAHQLYENHGDGTFEARGAAWGFALEGEALHGGQSVTLGDYDLDGRLDAHVNGWIEPHNVPGSLEDFEAGGPHGSRLLHNLGDRFEDVTEAAEVSLAGINEKGIYGFSSAFVDLDEDGWPELAVAGDFRTSRIFWNQGALLDTDPSLPHFLDGSGDVNKESNAMGASFGDFDLDGRMDWYVTSIAERDAECPDTCSWKGNGNRLYRNLGARSFSVEDAAVGVSDGGWAWGTAFFDMDNDADLDLLAVNGWPGRDLNGGVSHRFFPARLWRNLRANAGGVVMPEVAALLGADDEGMGRAVLPFDYDMDGDLDLFISNHAQAPRLLRNDGGNAAPWLQVEVEGTSSNRDGRGAVLELQVAPDGPVYVRQIGVGSHFLAEGPLVQHFGLGAGASEVHSLRVHWPASGRTQLLMGLDVRQRVHVRESD